MSDWSALMWTVRPGTEQQVEELFRNSGRPDHVIRDEQGNEKGRLLRTVVLVKDNVVIRAIEYEGTFQDVALHMRRQHEIKDLEAGLEAYLEEPRDMSTPEGTIDFFKKTSMRCILARVHDE